MNRALTATIILGLIFSSTLDRPTTQAEPLVRTNPQEANQSVVRKIIGAAQMHYQRGEKAYSEGNYDIARREFDEAVDTILTESIDVRSDQQLNTYYRELVEKVNHYQIAALEQKTEGLLSSDSSLSRLINLRNS